MENPGYGRKCQHSEKKEEEEEEECLCVCSKGFELKMCFLVEFCRQGGSHRAFAQDSRRFRWLTKQQQQQYYAAAEVAEEVFFSQDQHPKLGESSGAGQPYSDRHLGRHPSWAGGGDHWSQRERKIDSVESYQSVMGTTWRLHLSRRPGHHQTERPHGQTSHWHAVPNTTAL
jgi:hypothetical protein